MDIDSEAEKRAPHTVRLFIIMVLLAVPLTMAMICFTATPLMALVPMMFALFYARGGSGRWASVPMLALLVLLGTLTSPVFFAYAAYLIIAMLGLSLAFLPKRTFFQGMGIAFGALLAAGLCAVAVMALMLGDPVAFFMDELELAAREPTFGEALELPLRMLAAIYIMGQSASISVGAVVEQALAMERFRMIEIAVSQMGVMLRAQLPSMILTSSLLGGVYSFSFAAWRLGKGKKAFCNLPEAEGPLLPAFSAWSLPRGASFSMLAFLFLSSVVGMFATEPLALAASAAYTLFSLIFAIQGASTIDFLLKRKKVGAAARVVIIAAAYILLSLLLTMIGVFEQLFRVRMGYRLRDQMEQSGKKTQAPPPIWPPRFDDDDENDEEDDEEENP